MLMFNPEHNMTNKNQVRSYITHKLMFNPGHNMTHKKQERSYITHKHVHALNKVSTRSLMM